jgi:hypothetical protein
MNGDSILSEHEYNLKYSNKYCKANNTTSFTLHDTLTFYNNLVDWSNYAFEVQHAFST